MKVTWLRPQVFTSPVLNRGSWKKNVAFVGHTRPTTVSRFNPRLFTRDGPSKEGGGKFYVCAGTPIGLCCRGS